MSLSLDHSICIYLKMLFLILKEPVVFHSGYSWLTQRTNSEKYYSDSRSKQADESSVGMATQHWN